MSVAEIKKSLAALPRRDQDEVIAYLFHLRHESDKEYQERMSRRGRDLNPSHWLSPDQFESMLDKKKSE